MNRHKRSCLLSVELVKTRQWIFLYVIGKEQSRALLRFYKRMQQHSRRPLLDKCNRNWLSKRRWRNHIPSLDGKQIFGIIGREDETNIHTLGVVCLTIKSSDSAVCLSSFQRICFARLIFKLDYWSTHCNHFNFKLVNTMHTWSSVGEVRRWHREVTFHNLFNSVDEIVRSLARHSDLKHVVLLE